MNKELLNALADVLDGALGYFSECGTFAPYWDERRIQQAMLILKKLAPARWRVLAQFLPEA